MHELRRSGLSVDQQHPLEVQYDGIVVGEFFVNLLVKNRVTVELKAVSDLSNIHKAQCLNYLKAGNLETCLLINFGQPRIEIKRLSS